VRRLDVLILLAGLLLPLMGAVALAWSDRSYGWPAHPGLTVLLLWAAVALGGALVTRSSRQGAFFLAFILPVAIALGAAAAATNAVAWLWLQPALHPEGAGPAAGGAGRVVFGTAIGLGVPLGFVAAHAVALEELLTRKLRGVAHAR
jgi:hypothetical protein